MAVDIRRPLRKLLPVLLKAQEENLNEADTVQRLMMFLEEVLGYDSLSDLTRETQVKDKYVDIAVKVDGALKLLVEAKSAGTDLRDRHIEQAKTYAAEANLRWVVLTNGVVWILYHLEFDEGLDAVRVFTANLAVDVDKAAEELGLLHRKSIVKGDLEEYWSKRAALDPSSVGKALYCENVLRLVRREIKKREGILVDEEDLANAIHGMFSAEARERIGPVKIRRRRTRATKAAEETPTPPASPPPAATAQKP